MAAVARVAIRQLKLNFTHRGRLQNTGGLTSMLEGEVNSRGRWSDVMKFVLAREVKGAILTSMAWGTLDIVHN